LIEEVSMLPHLLLQSQMEAQEAEIKSTTHLSSCISMSNTDKVYE